MKEKFDSRFVVAIFKSTAGDCYAFTVRRHTTIEVATSEASAFHNVPLTFIRWEEL